MARTGDVAESVGSKRSTLVKRAGGSGWPLIDGGALEHGGQSTRARAHGGCGGGVGVALPVLQWSVRSDTCMMWTWMCSDGRCRVSGSVCWPVHPRGDALAAIFSRQSLGCDNLCDNWACGRLKF